MEPVETLVNSRVRRLAEYLEIDPKVAQELYYQSGLWNSIDGLEHKARKEELGNLRSLRKALAKHSPKFEHQDVIQTTFRIDGFNLKKTLAHLEEQLELMVGFGEAKMREETSGTRAIKRAHEVARFVAELFEVDEPGLSQGQVEELLLERDLTGELREVEVDDPSDPRIDVVFEQSLSAGDEVDKGSTVTYVIGRFIAPETTTSSTTSSTTSTSTTSTTTSTTSTVPASTSTAPSPSTTTS